MNLMNTMPIFKTRSKKVYLPISQFKPEEPTMQEQIYPPIPSEIHVPLFKQGVLWQARTNYIITFYNSFYL